MRECIWHQYYYKNWKWRIVHFLFRIIGLDKGEVWTNFSTMESKDVVFPHITYSIEINRSDMGRTELLVIKVY